MAKTKIENLREHLFLTVERLLDEDNPLELERAKAVVDVSKAIIDSGRAEIEAQKLLLQAQSEFSESLKELPIFFQDPKQNPQLIK